MSSAHAVHSIGSFDTDIVVDLGCLSYLRGNLMEDSINALVRRFKPSILFGFDPHPALKEAVGQVHGTTVITSRRAAWTNDEEIGLSLQSNCTHVDLHEKQRTKTFDLASWVRTLPETGIVLKIDVEGAEYVLLPHLIQHGLIDRFSHILVEWHTGKLANGYETDRESILKEIHCRVEEWQ